MRYFVAIIGLVYAIPAFPALADSPKGFAIASFNKAQEISLNVEGKRFVRRVKPDRISFTCLNCRSTENVDLNLSKSTDGAEGRFRSGENSIAKIEAGCKSRDPACSIEAVTINGAVGWVSSTGFGRFGLSMTSLFKNGDKLEIQSMAESREAALTNARAALDQIAPIIVGKE
ncbi:hypothetical protein [Aquidulcibacter sp.]|uniref:hypothetical protein n=1 Tax=Aquidulcibacter sp. TaxID=2052990 RepID=UPI0025C4F2A5|nr:hypothetical protein [Aquidulcibacter sp.]MCA3697377.1 hypothetical protein [Aquidulcibacter sp.]